tara:strand:- start:277793 stop:278302 length:510 start_codon:yes stop_codon:yes gene_type:complete
MIIFVMGQKIVIKKNINMKNGIVFILLIFTTCLLFSQNDNTDSYKLFKDGKNYPRPIIYLLDDKANIVDEIETGNKLFIFKKEIFRHSAEKHNYELLSKSKIKNIEFVDVSKLLEIEHTEFLRKSEEIEAENGFKPAAPIKHKILKTFVLLSENDTYQVYEVDWEFSRF